MESQRVQSQRTTTANAFHTAVRLRHAIAQLDAAAKLAIVCVFFGWFLMNTLVVSWGSLQHGVRFFDMGAVAADPSRLFFGLGTGFTHPLLGLVCVACLCAPLWPHLDRRPVAWLGYVAPLALMVGTAVLLYVKTSGDMIAAAAPPDSVAHSVIRFANDVARRGGDIVGKHVGLGAGAYLALIGSGVLAVQGLRRLSQRR